MGAFVALIRIAFQSNLILRQAFTIELLLLRYHGKRNSLFVMPLIGRDRGKQE